MPNVWCTESAPDKVEIFISKLSQESAVHRLGSFKNWSGNKLYCCDIADPIPMSIHLIFSLLAQCPSLLTKCQYIVTPCHGLDC